MRGSNQRTIRVPRPLSRVPLVMLLIVAVASACNNGDGNDVTPIPTATRPAATNVAAPVATGTPTESASPTAPATNAASPTRPESTGVPPVAGYRIVNIYPHDTNAFTEGLDIDDGELFEGTGLNGLSSMRRVDLETGAVLQQVNLAEEYFGEGIVVLGERIYQITWQSQTAFVYDRATFEQIETHAYPTEGWGMTTDGERLIMSDGSSTLFFRDPDTFGEIRHVEVLDGDDPVNRLNELEWVNGEIWANIWQTDTIARIDPATGAVIGWIDLTGLLQPNDQGGHEVDVLNGIAVDDTSGRIYVTGKLWPVLYEIEVVAP